ncbi:thiaminase II [Sphingobacteriaceae bacterium WQ 2009]|uniref:Aminopyrimidine aminohydrolase n=1 Tax=Rhinopithecimicrobium faecis TaxID=2820698 RepID=A0A8T4HG70_9SPHI|nr:thiaminase II [Sphingobacteriaceae bacterium WQ 2009]
MKWSEATWQESQAIYSAIINLPFIQEMTAGTLEVTKFQFYLKQDALYLTYFGSVLAAIAAKLADPKHALAYLGYAEQAIVVERVLHESFFKQYAIADYGEMQPSCHHYCHYLRAVVGFESVEVAAAATLPCFWIYGEVGRYIKDRVQQPNNPYQAWVDTYAAADFNTSVTEAIAICDALAENASEATREQMTKAFLRAAYFEYDFWLAAQTQVSWTPL